MPHYQVDRLARAGGDEHIGRVGLDAELPRTHHDLMPQRRVAQWRGVVDYRMRIGARYLTDGLRQAIDIAPVCRHEAAAELEHAVGVAELLEDVFGLGLRPARV